MTSGVALKTQAERPASRFDRTYYFPPEWNELVAEFLALFHRYSYILKPLEGGPWFSANETWALTDTEILKAIALVHPKYIIGTRAGRATRFALLDIDAGSKYHNKESIDNIRQILSNAGIAQTVVYRSSHSDGWHLYIFFDEPVSSKDLRKQLIQLLQLKGITIAKGTLEVFPHPGQGSQGQGLRLPLQPGFGWLDQKDLELEYDRLEFSATKALTYFMDEVHCSANSRHAFHRMKRYVEDLMANRESIKSQYQEKLPSKQPGVVVPFKKSIKTVTAHSDNAAAEVEMVFGTTPPGMLPDIWSRGREFAADGLTGPSQRADAIFCLNHYLFYGDPEQGKPALGYGYADERAWAVEQILQDKHNGQSKDITRGTSDALAQITRAANWIPPHKRGEEVTRYESKVPIAYIRHNANQAADACKRIQKALDEFTEANQPFSIRDLKEKSGCWEKTLYNHQDLWRPVQERLRANHFAGVAPEYNAGEGAGPQETCPPAQPSTKIAPPGLLAARQIAYEISRRAQKEKEKQQKAAARRSNASESEWVDRVASLTSEKPSEVPIERLKSLVIVLIHYLSISPCEESARSLQMYIQDVKKELSLRHLGVTEKPESG